VYSNSGTTSCHFCCNCSINCINTNNNKLKDL
jgi:hypothetical protein